MQKYIDLAMKRQNCSQNELGRRLGVTGSMVSQMRRENVPVSAELIAKLARLCGVKPEEILAEHELLKPHAPEVRAMWERIKGQAVAAALIGLGVLIWIPQGVVYILCKIPQIGEVHVNTFERSFFGLACR